MGALPNLCARTAQYLGVSTDEWIVDPQPIKQPRSALVDERVPSPKRPPRKDNVERAITLAQRRPADGIIIICDADDDCAAVWGPQTSDLISLRYGRQIDKICDAKGALKSLAAGYKPTTHQLDLTRKIDIGRLRSLSPSFNKFVRTLAHTFNVPCPEPAS